MPNRCRSVAWKSWTWTGLTHGVHAQIVGFAVTEARLHAAAGHPDGEGIGMMVAAPARPIVEVALNERRAAEFSAPNDQRVVQESALLKVADQGGARLVGVFALGVELGGQLNCADPSRRASTARTARRARPVAGPSGSCGRTCPAL